MKFVPFGMVRALLFLSLAHLFLMPMACGLDWPKHYVLAKGSESPDGRYGILWAEKAYIVENDGPEVAEILEINYVADLRNHTAISSYECSSIFEGANHDGLLTTWAPDGSWCFAVYDSRWSFNSIRLLRRDGRTGRFRAIDLGEHILRAWKKNDISYESVGARADGSGHIEIGGLGTSHPRYTDDPDELKAKVNIHFHGVYDLSSGRWLSSEATVISEEVHSMIEKGLWDNSGHSGWIETRANDLDADLNAVYQALKTLYPPKRFEELKKEQLKWLKGSGPKPSKEESQRVEQRIEELRQLLRVA